MLMRKLRRPSGKSSTYSVTPSSAAGVASTAEILVTGLPEQTTLADRDIVSRIFHFIGAQNLLGHVYNSRRMRSNNASSQQQQLVGGTNRTPYKSYSLILQITSVQIRDAIIRLKIAKGPMPVSTIYHDFPQLMGSTDSKIFVNEFLSSNTYKLLKTTREHAKRCRYERVWVRNERIFVRKDENSQPMLISCEADLKNLI